LGRKEGAAAHRERTQRQEGLCRGQVGQVGQVGQEEAGAMEAIRRQSDRGENGDTDLASER